MKNKEIEKEMLELRMAGHTYKEIGKKFGVSAQRVHFAIGGMVRKDRAYIERIVYEGIYQLFVQDRKMTFHKLARIIYGSANKIHAEAVGKFVTGELDRKFSLTQINNLLRYIGKPYEEVFRRREEQEGEE